MEPQEGLRLVMAACEGVLRDDRAGSLLQQAIAAAHRGDHAAAIELSQEAVRVAPSYVDALVVLSDLLLYDASQPAAALKCLKRVLVREPDNSLATWRLAGEALRKGQAVEACDLLTGAVEQQPPDLYVAITLLWLLQMMGRPQEAEELLRNAMFASDAGLVCQTLIEHLRSRGCPNGPRRSRHRSVSSADRHNALDRLCQVNKMAGVLPNVGSGEKRGHPSAVRAATADIRCRHVENPMLGLCSERYGPRVARHYEREFRKQFLDPEIDVALRRSGVIHQNLAGNADIRIPSDMVLVPGGKYTIGDHHPNTNNPQRRCAVRGFLIDRCPVTNGQWREFRPDHQYPRGLDTHPVVNVHFVEVTLYARWRGKRLPTETEWEAAARGPNGWVFPWGQMPDPKRANCADQRLSATTSVTQFPGGASSCGAWDMMGNVQEWVDEWGPRPHGRPAVCITKGGGRIIPSPGLQCWLRVFALPLTRYPNIGFRCAKDVP